jgi:UDP-glucose 4-epimerase
MKRILITGATGFIGGHLVSEALKLGFQVTAAVRKSSNTSAIGLDGVTLAILSFDDQPKLVSELAKLGPFDYVIHNAGVTKAIEKQTYFDVNLGLTSRLVEAIIESKTTPERFVYVSSLAAIGAAPHQKERVFLDQIPRPLTQYGASKLSAEVWLRNQGTTFPWVIGRPTAVFGPGERDILQVIHMIKNRLNITTGHRGQKLSFVYGADVAKALLLLATTPVAAYKAYIISDGRDYTSKHLTKAVKQALGTHVTLNIHVPTWLMHPIAAIVEKIGGIRGKATPLNRDKMAELNAENWLCDSTNLKTDTGFEPQYDLFEGMRATVAWYKEHKWL